MIPKQILGILATFSILVTQALAEENITIDRTPLTFRDSGLYSNLSSVHGVDPTKDGVRNLLTVERAADPDTPWDFYIVQYNATGPSRDLAIRLKELARNGKKVILRVLLGKEKLKIDLERAKKRLDDLFLQTDPDWLYAITLDEENVYWLGNMEKLTELYNYAKGRWPKLPVYQWWTPMVAPDVRAKRGWVALPADGWVMDLYGRHGDEFEKKTLKFLETGKPLVHIAWASPTWMFYEKEGYTKDDWWEKAGRPIFDEQLRLCREYNVPVAYFCCQQAETKDGKKIAPIRWGWHAVDPATRRWFRELETIVSNFDYLPDEEIGFRQRTARKFDWAHSVPTVRVRISLDQNDRKRFSWQTEFPEVSTAVGEHAVPTPYKNPYMRLFYVLDASARYLQGGFSVASVDKRSVSVPIVFRAVPLRPSTDWRVTVGVTASRPLGGSARLSFSADGKRWTEDVGTDPKLAKQTLTIDRSQAKSVQGTAPLWIRVTLCANAGVKTNTATRLNSLEVSASLK